MPRSDAICQLIHTIKQIDEISDPLSFGPIEKARRIPNQRMQEVRSVPVGETSYTGKPDDNPTRIIKEAREIMAQQAYQKGRDERDAKLKDLASKLEQLRAVLPSLAAQAAIDIGILARALKAEADERRE